MAICGPKLYQDDVAHEARGRVLELVDDGLPPDDAVHRIVEESDGLADDAPAFRCPFWLAIAETEVSGRALGARA